MVAMNNLNVAPLVLLIRRSETESSEELFAYLRARYDARLHDADWGPKYKIGPTFTYRGHKFTHIQTFAGSLVVQIVFDTRSGKCDRPVIFRFDSGDRLTLLSPGGSQSEVDEAELIQS